MHCLTVPEYRNTLFHWVKAGEFAGVHFFKLSLHQLPTGGSQTTLNVYTIQRFTSFTAFLQGRRKQF